MWPISDIEYNWESLYTLVFYFSHNFVFHKKITFPIIALPNVLRVLFENRPALYFCKYKENKKKNNTRILDTLFIDDFSDIMVNVSIIRIIIK